MLLTLEKREIDMVSKLIRKQMGSLESELKNKKFSETIMKIGLEGIERDKKLLAYLKEKSDECED
jgi:hypothetical protein